ncbi:MAG: efflux RND transporter periplasmic adaptor subunit [Micromonosporaceae bacterium]|nr:efflux RND transporter periplasmic adaptor subunit [Micromonosporaceae bacterium]
MKVRLTNLLGAPNGRRVVWLAGGVAVIVGTALTAVLIATSGDAPQTVASATKVQRGTVTTTVSAAGTAQALASRPLSFSMSGTVVELNVTAGDVVAAGTVLAKIDDEDALSAVEDAQEKVDDAQEAVDRATASLSSGTTTTAALSPISYLTDDSSPSPSPSGSESASASPCPSASCPSCPSCPSCSPCPTTTAPTSGSEGSGRTGGSTGGSTGGGSTGGSTGGDSSGSGRSGGSTSDSLLSAQEQLNNAKRTLLEKQVQLAGTVITAPVAGKILSVAGLLGSKASQSSSGFIVLAGTNDVAVTAQFTEAEVTKIAVDQTAAITLPNLPGQEFAGKVLQIDPAGTISTKLVRYAAVIAFDTIPETVLYGQTANVAVITESAADVLYVPSTAISGRNDTTATVVVRANGKEERRTVQIGLRGDVSTEITSGLAEGEEVLTVSR